MQVLPQRQNDIARKEDCHRNHQSQHHYERVVLRESGLRSTEQRRHQTHDECCDSVDDAIDEILVETADDATNKSAQCRKAVDNAVDEPRIKSINTTREIHCAARDGPTVEFVNPVFVEAGGVKRAQSS